MPQFNLLYFSSQIFWLVISFTILYMVMAFTFLPKIRNILKKRDEKLQKILTQADQLNKKAKEIEEEYDAYILDAEHHADSILNTARQTIEEKGDKQEEQQAKQTQESMDKLQKDIEQKKILILEKLDDVCTFFIQALFRVVYKKETSLSSLRKAVRKAAKEVRNV